MTLGEQTYCVFVPSEAGTASQVKTRLRELAKAQRALRMKFMFGKRAGKSTGAPAAMVAAYPANGGKR